MLKSTIRFITYISVLSIVIFSCTKEITDDIFSHIESFFTFQASVDKNEIELDERINFTLELEEFELPSEYALNFSTNGDGEFNSNTLDLGLNTNINPGTHNITYLPTSVGAHQIAFTVTNANDEPLTVTETININVGEVTEFEPSFAVIVNTDLSNVNEEGIATVNEGNIITVTVRIIEENDNVPDNTEYIINFSSSATGLFVFEEENYTGENQVIVTEKELVFEFTPEEIEEYDLKFSIISRFDDTSICDSAIFIVKASSSEIPVISLNGENPLTLTVGEIYTEEALVTDDIDENLEIVFGGTFDGTSNTVGEFTRTYNVEDLEGNSAEEKIRTIIVINDDTQNTFNDIVSFLIENQVGVSQINTTEYTVNLIVPFNTDVTNLIPSIGVSVGATISPEGEQDFTNPVIYEVTAENGNLQEWTVTISIQTDVRSESNDITLFEVQDQVGVSEINTTEHTVNLMVPFGVDITNLTPIIEVSEGASISPEGAQDYTNSVTYDVEAENRDQQEWIVTVSIQTDVRNEANDITAFSFTEQEGDTVIDLVEHTVELEVPFGTNVTSLTPSISVSLGASIDPIGTQNFSTPFIYEVQAENGDKQEWTVIVTVQNDTRSDANDITSFMIANQIGESDINDVNHTVDILMPFGTDISNLNTVISISAEAVISDEGATNFTTPNTYIVTAENGELQQWLVTVSIQRNNPPVASVEVDVTIGTAPLTVNFDGSGSTDQDGDLLTYQWFENGTLFNAIEMPSKTFIEAGEYEIELIVSDGNGGNSSETVTIIVTETNSEPVASILTNVTSGEAPLTINFDASDSTDADGDTLTYQWFENGTLFNAIEMPSRTFTEAGTYEIELEVSDGNGGEDAITVQIIVTEPNNRPVIEDIGVSPTTGTTETVFTFDGSNSSDPDGDALSYAWSDGNSVFSTSVNAMHTFGTAGTYTVILTVNDGNGGTDSFPVNVTVEDVLSNENDITSVSINGINYGSDIDRINHTVNIEVPIGTALEFNLFTPTVSGGANYENTQGGNLDNGIILEYEVTAANGDVQVWLVTAVYEIIVVTEPSFDRDTGVLLAPAGSVIRVAMQSGQGNAIITAETYGTATNCSGIQGCQNSPDDTNSDLGTLIFEFIMPNSNIVNFTASFESFSQLVIRVDGEDVINDFFEIQDVIPSR